MPLNPVRIAGVLLQRQLEKGVWGSPHAVESSHWGDHCRVDSVSDKIKINTGEPVGVKCRLS